MKKKVIAFFNRLQPIFGRLGNNKYLQAIMGAMMATLGPMILGSTYDFRVVSNSNSCIRW